MDKKTIYNDILQEYSNIRSKTKQDYELKKHEIYERVPRLKEVENELSRIGLDAARHIIKNPDSSELLVRELQFLSEKLREEKLNILDKYNIPIDSLNEKHICSKCKDTGFIGSEKCDCFKRKLASKYFKTSNMENLLVNENFDTFNLALFSDNNENGISQRDNMKKHMLKAMDFGSAIKSGKNSNILLYGPSGQGKTFLSSCIAKDLIENGYSVLYLTAFKLIDLIRNIRFSNDINVNFEERYNLLLDVDLLIIDDLGTELVSNFSKAEIFNIINSRINDRRSTLISTNLTLNELIDTYSSRIASRIIGNYEPLEFFGPDVRWEIN
jgi:DNA replication protein DnaC